jgi:hypothetical protein
MIILLTVLGYMLGNGEFGARLINGLEYANVWVWVLTVLLFLAGTIVSFVVLFTNTNINKISNGKFLSLFDKLGKGLFVAFIMCFVIAYPAFILFLIHFTIQNIDPNITSISELSTNSIVSMTVLLILSIRGLFTSTFTKKGK